MYASHNHQIGYALYLSGHIQVSARPLLTIQRRTDNHLAPVQEQIFQLLGEHVEDIITGTLVIYGYGQKEKLIYGGFVAGASQDIAVPDHHVPRYIYCDRYFLSLPK